MIETVGGPCRLHVFLHFSTNEGESACGEVDLIRTQGGAWSICAVNPAPGALAPIVFLPPGASADDAVVGLVTVIRAR